MRLDCIQAKTILGKHLKHSVYIIRLFELNNLFVYHFNLIVKFLEQFIHVFELFFSDASEATNLAFWLDVEFSISNPHRDSVVEVDDSVASELMIRVLTAIQYFFYYTLLL